jgi:hypothetical protein
MKNVAATRGHNVNFADFLGDAIAREGNWAGRDNVLNFLSRPPSAILALFSQLHGASPQIAEYVYFFLMQEKYAGKWKYFQGRGAAGRATFFLVRRRLNTAKKKTAAKKRRRRAPPPPGNFLLFWR